MTRKKAESERARRVQVSYRPDQEEKVLQLQAKRELSPRFQEFLDALQ